MKSITFNYIYEFFIISSVLFSNVVTDIYTFTNAGSEGRKVPTQSDCDSEYSGQSLRERFHGWKQGYSDVDRTFRWFIYNRGIRCGGWKANIALTRRGGKGARMKGIFHLVEGQVLTILVGQRGSHGI